MTQAYDEVVLQHVCDMYHRLGGNTSQLAKALGKPRSTCRHMLRRIKVLGLMPGGRGVPPVPHFTIRTDAISHSSKLRLICIGDAHDSPALPDKSRFAHIGAYIRAVKPDVVVQVGDFATLDSLSNFIPNASYSGREKPVFQDDMNSFDQALSALAIEGPERHCTLGNHEQRLFQFEERAPEAYGMMRATLQDVFARHGWTFSPYGEITLYGGVGFVHTALNRLGQPYGGRAVESAIAADALHDLVLGHTHTEQRHRAAKLGGNNYVQVINVGCALPQGHVEDYAKHALTGWSYGITDMTIQHGHVQDYRFVTMAKIADSYGTRKV